MTNYLHIANTRSWQLGAYVHSASGRLWGFVTNNEDPAYLECRSVHGAAFRLGREVARYSGCHYGSK